MQDAPFIWPLLSYYSVSPGLRVLSWTWPIAIEVVFDAISWDYQPKLACLSKFCFSQS